MSSNCCCETPIPPRVTVPFNLKRYTSAGVLVWHRDLDLDYVWDARQTTSTTAVAVGWRRYWAGSSWATDGTYLVKFDLTTGDRLWEYLVGIGGTSHKYALAVNHFDNQQVLCCHRTNYQVMAYVDADGNEVWSTTPASVIAEGFPTIVNSSKAFMPAPYIIDLTDGSVTAMPTGNDIVDNFSTDDQEFWERMFSVAGGSGGNDNATFCTTASAIISQVHGYDYFATYNVTGYWSAADKPGTVDYTVNTTDYANFSTYKGAVDWSNQTRFQDTGTVGVSAGDTTITTDIDIPFLPYYAENKMLADGPLQASASSLRDPAWYETVLNLGGISDDPVITTHGTDGGTTGTTPVTYGSSVPFVYSGADESFIVSAIGEKYGSHGIYVSGYTARVAQNWFQTTTGAKNLQFNGEYVSAVNHANLSFGWVFGSDPTITSSGSQVMSDCFDYLGASGGYTQWQERTNPANDPEASLDVTEQYRPLSITVSSEESSLANDPYYNNTIGTSFWRRIEESQGYDGNNFHFTYGLWTPGTEAPGSFGDAAFGDQVELVKYTSISASNFIYNNNQYSLSGTTLSKTTPGYLTDLFSESDWVSTEGTFMWRGLKTSGSGFAATFHRAYNAAVPSNPYNLRPNARVGWVSLSGTTTSLEWQEKYGQLLRWRHLTPNSGTQDNQETFKPIAIDSTSGDIVFISDRSWPSYW